MATVPTTATQSSGSASGSGGSGARKSRGSGFTSWLKKGSSSESLANSKKLASPAEEIKLVFLRQLELSSLDLNGKHYHSVFTGAQIVDIILKHFGLPDRKLALNVASRLIDCSLYTHVSGPSQVEGTAGTVIDSNTEMYTLTSSALSALKTMHKGDTLQRAKTHTRKRYMDLRGHLYTRSVDSPGTSSSNISDGSSSNSSQHASIAGLNASSSPSSSSSHSPSPPSLHTPRTQLPAPLDLGIARKPVIGSNKSNSPSDTLVGIGPATPTSTGTRATGDVVAESAGLALREVSIPTGDFGGLLNTWSFMGRRHSQQQQQQLLTPSSEPGYAQQAMESDYDSGDSRNSQQQQQHNRMSQDLESAELAQQHQRQRRWAMYPEASGGGRLRRWPSAPSVCGNASDSEVSYLTAFRDSAVVARRRSRDSWSDMTVGGAQVGGSTLSFGSGYAAAVAMQRLSVTSSLRPWHPARSSVGSALDGMESALESMATRRAMRASEIDSSARSRSSSVQMEQGRLSIEPTGRDSDRSSIEPATGDSDQFSMEPNGFPRQLRLWRDTVPTALLQELGPETVALQEAIHELISTEAAYLHDLELIDTVFVAPLLARPEVMDGTRALEFLQEVFFNYRALIDNSRRLCAQLAERQLIDAPVVGGVGDIFDVWADDLQAFIEYSVHVPAAQSELEAELLSSAALAQFLADAEAAPTARRLPIQSFIGRPATRFARYPLLLDAIVKRSPGDTDRLRSAAAKVRSALRSIDRRTGEGAAAHRMRQIGQRLVLAAGARGSLALDSTSRRLVKEGVLHVAATGARVLVFLFDNSLVVATEERVAHARGVARYVADDRIIPISMLDASAVPSEAPGALGGIRDALSRHSSSSSTVGRAGTGAALAFDHIGCRALGRTLVAASDADRARWIAAVARRTCAPQTLVEAYTDVRLLSDKDFGHSRAPLCSALFASHASACRMALYGSRDGLHLGIHAVPTSVVRVSAPGCVAKIHVLSHFGLAVVLSEGNLLVYSLDAIEHAATLQMVAGTKIASSVAFFDVGLFMAKPLIVMMKMRGSKSHFKCIQPRHSRIDSSDSPPTPDNNPSELLPSLRVVYQGTRASLHLVGEFGVPAKARRVHFLRRKLCIVSAKSFEIVDVQTSRLLRTLPDPLDDDFSFVIHNNTTTGDNSGLALAACKVGRDFLLCYEAFAFFIDNFGRRARPHVFIRWEMAPTHVSFRHPYVVAINPRFIEVRHIETGVLLSVIRIRNAVCLNPDDSSTSLHIAVSPNTTIGTPLLLADNDDDDNNDNESTTSSAIPRPVSTTTATSTGDSAPVRGYIVPGLAGSSGKRLFPEGCPSHYRIVEIRLPPLKSSSK